MFSEAYLALRDAERLIDAKIDALYIGCSLPNDMETQAAFSKLLHVRESLRTRMKKYLNGEIEL